MRNWIDSGGRQDAAELFGRFKWYQLKIATMTNDNPVPAVGLILQLLVLILVVVCIIWLIRISQKRNRQANESVPVTSPRLPSSGIAGLFTFFAVINFLMGGLGFFLLVAGNSYDEQAGFKFAVIGMSGGFGLLAFAKIINCLHESTHRLRNIQELLERQKTDDDAKS